MSNEIYAQYPTEIQGSLKFYDTGDCEIDFHDFSKTFCVYLFFQIDTGLEIAV